MAFVRPHQQSLGASLCGISGAGGPIYPNALLQQLRRTHTDQEGTPEEKQGATERVRRGPHCARAKALAEKVEAQMIEPLLALTAKHIVEDITKKAM